MTRDPNKRRVKPVKHNMLMDFADDESDDDDYKIPTGDIFCVILV